MTLMNSLIKSTTPAPPKMIVYGQPGVGKTTFAASANAVLLDCENGAGAVANLTRTPYLQSWPQMRKWLVELADLDKADAPQALAIDTIDWMVQRIVEHVVLDLDGKSQGDITNTLGTAHGGYFKAREIEDRLGVKAHKRLPELRRAGMVRNGKSRTCTVSGKQALTWHPNVGNHCAGELA